MNQLTSMEYKEIIQVLKSKIENFEDFANEEYDVEELGLGEVIELVQEGGEGEGDSWSSVKYFKDHDIYIEVIGHYTSYYGTSFDGWESCFNVKPAEKTITIYQVIK